MASEPPACACQRRHQSASHHKSMMSCPAPFDLLVSRTSHSHTAQSITMPPHNARCCRFSTSLRQPHPGNGRQAACVPGLAHCSGLVDLLLQYLV